MHTCLFEEESRYHDRFRVAAASESEFTPSRSNTLSKKAASFSGIKYLIPVNNNINMIQFTCHTVNNKTKSGMVLNGVVSSTAISTQKSTVRHNVEESNKNTKTSLTGTNHTADFSDVVHKASQLCYRNLQMAIP